MSGKVQKIYEALLSGAQAGRADDVLFDHVLEQCPKATSKKIVKASLFALSDPDLKDGNTLNVIYALAIKHRLNPVTKNDIGKNEVAPKVKKKAAVSKKAKAGAEALQ